MTKRTRSYVEEAFNNIMDMPGVLDVVVLNAAGNPVKTTFEEQKSLEHAGMWSQLMQKSQYAIKQIDSDDDVMFLRVRTKQHETFITPDEKLTFIVIQNPSDKTALPQEEMLSVVSATLQKHV